MRPGRRATAARALRLMARRLDFRADILKQVAMPANDKAIVELRAMASIYRAAAVRLHASQGRTPEWEAEEAVGKYRVYMRYERALGSWRVSFTAQGFRCQLKDLTFADSSKIETIALRAGALTDLATKQALEMGIRKGLGGLMLVLTEQQIKQMRSR